MPLPLEHLNPEGLPRNPAFAPAVAVTGPHGTVYVGGQNAVDAAGQIVTAVEPADCRAYRDASAHRGRRIVCVNRA